ncbi:MULTISPECIES: hypothetical protein [Rufibacter]|uniref:Outer membrane protein beta-barrel domain-containing protein n=1 Tax=Rufibacter quisquiliarum TaxID=1549639 RepID=A0A839GGT1_9BACT|nr:MULTISPECIES: hypothetical protein [Rufibacter]MBA9078102.1 hypothetical protein [Rufibacter quisquiliarum]
MKKLRFIFGLSLLWCCLFSVTQARAQQHGVGIRVGGLSSGISGKYFLNGSAAIEAIIGTSFGRKGFHLTGLYELHASALGVPGLQWFYGAGAHIGSYKGRYYHDRTYKHYYDSANKTLATVGIDGIVGLEYQITEIPVSVGIDFKPFLDVNQDGLFLFPDGALTVRYTF